MIAIALAVGAAFLFALGTVLQQKGGSEESADAGMQADFLAKLAQRPVWLLGVLVEVIGFGLQATALGLGRLIVVQPIQVTSVVFALPLGVWLTAQIVNRREILGAVLTTAGSSPSSCSQTPPAAPTTRRSAHGWWPAASASASRWCWSARR